MLARDKERLKRFEADIPGTGAGDDRARPRFDHRDRRDRGATLRGGALFAGFAPAKAAQRSLAQSMARVLGPQGILRRLRRGG